jgi:hypothetical protein
VRERSSSARPTRRGNAIEKIGDGGAITLKRKTVKQNDTRLKKALREFCEKKGGWAPASQTI